MGCIGCSCANSGCKTGVSLAAFLAKTFGDEEPESVADSAFDFPFAEVEFATRRSEFYRNETNLTLKKGDDVVVEAEGGYDIGKVKSLGKTAKFKMERKNVPMDSPDVLSVIRVATPEDLALHRRHIEQLPSVKRFTLAKIEELGLEMKYVDAEIRLDEKRITIYFTADQRVDFRELVKLLAAQFKTRIQLTQISPREEAKRVGGIGSCGRTLCCSTWLPDFEHVTADAAKNQNLPLNATRLNGQCGRLKCCLNYELDSYVALLQKFPAIDSRVKTERGVARVEKIDIFKEEIWLHHEDGAWTTLSLERFNALFVKR
ncbi:MAG: regulatory iron-sulfur-containing complex subunit RicT [Chloroherpetonaceae bacterium]|nr:regulatory iron-sulfur-containing complex subunit RicT [Chloroherpetonaceae bacterium]